MQKVPNVTLHRSSLSNCARIIKGNLNETTPGAGDNLPRLDPYHRSVGNYFHALGAVMGLDLGSPQFYRNDINLALEQVREAMPEGPVVPPFVPPTAGDPIPNQIGTVGVPFFLDLGLHYNGDWDFITQSPWPADPPYIGYPADSYDSSTGIISFTPTDVMDETCQTTAESLQGGGTPTITYLMSVVAAPAIPITEATEVVGAIGTWGPAGHDNVIPADLAAMVGITAIPSTDWTPGSYMRTVDNQNCHWDGTAWLLGSKVAPPPIFLGPILDQEPMGTWIHDFSQYFTGDIGFFTSVGFPNNLSLNNDTGISEGSGNSFSWGNPVPVSVRARPTGGSSADDVSSNEFIMTPQEPEIPPVFSGVILDQVGTVGVEFTGFPDLGAYFEMNPTVTYTVDVAFQADMVIVDTSVIGIPIAASTISHVITASNSLGSAASNAFLITIAEDSPS